jgi:hypothetical protein
MNLPRVRCSPSSTYSLAQRFVLGVSLLLGAGGCLPTTEEEAPDAVGATSEELRVANSLTTRALVLNAITTNPEAIPLLVGNGLVPLFAPGSGNAYLQQQLVDADARQVMSYLVGCALPAGASVPWKNPATGLVEQWDGKLGLCPEWKVGEPTPACLNWVSACLLARNNALGRRVELSLRGEDPTRPTLFSLESASRPVAFDPVTDAPVPSLAACTTSQTGAERDCGWKAEFIGQCQPGQPVRLGAGGRAPDQCTTGPVLGAAAGARMMLRACGDIFGCDQASGRMLAQSEGACATLAPSVKFTCPSTGFFTVQSAPHDSTLTGTVTVAAETGTPAATLYPTSEARTFFLREGAYYGNIFEPKSLAVTVSVDRDGKIQGKEQVVRGAVYRKMYSCQAAGWSTAQAYATNRLCALPGQDSNCAATSVGTCVDPRDTRYPASHCRLDDGSLVRGDGDFEQCQDTLGNKWMEPITVFLHDACGVVRDDCGTK